MTYRQAIQLQLLALQKVFDNANALRDEAFSQEEKQCFNGVRGHLPNVMRFFCILDDCLTDEIAATELKGNFSITTKIEDL